MYFGKGGFEAPRSGKLNIPAWDGSPAHWRRYKREVYWFLHGTKKDERSLVVSRLLPGLSGPAKETVVKWNALDFENESGCEDFLRRLGRTPLVRRALPDASMAFDKYLSEFRRRGGETIASFLTREDTVHENFVEAMERLVEQRREKKEREREAAGS